MRFGLVLSLCIVALALAACDGAPPAPPAGNPTSVAPPAEGTPQAGGPRANRTLPAGFTPPANFTPGGQRSGAQRTPQPAATNAPSSASTLAAPTAVIVGAITNTTGIAPTAVPIPVVSIPTAVPAVPVANSTSAPNTSTTRTPSTLPTVPAPPTSAAPTSLDALRGKIVFFSDRAGGYPQLYVMDADGSNQRLCNCSGALQTMVTNEVTSPDKRQFLFVKVLGGGPRSQGDQQIWAHHNDDGYEALVTGAAPGFPTLDYDAVWSPNAKHIAWVSQTNGYDEIYLYDASSGENLRLTQSSSEWYKHPSFALDGSLLTFWTNKENAAVKQVWVMELDGGDAHNISRNGYNDWDPIWVK